MRGDYQGWTWDFLGLVWRLRPIDMRSARLTDAEMVPSTWNDPSYHPLMRRESINLLSRAHTILWTNVATDR